MELCEGNLEDYVFGKLLSVPKNSLDDKIILGEITLGLAHIHKRNMIHKDLRPPNIMLWRGTAHSSLVTAKIADFGLAEQLKPGQNEFSETLNPGPLSILAPELLAKVAGSRRKTKIQFTYQSDAYALGIVIAFTVLKGKHPYGELDEFLLQSILMSKGCEPIGLRELNWDAIDLILKLTNREPKDRPDVPLVIFHPYFALTNKHTQAHFEDKMYQLLSLFQSEANVIRKIVFDRENINKWIEKVEKEQPKTKVNEENDLMKSLKRVRLV